MKVNAGISEKWIKASIIGTIWAASEIVLGSFFHNLKIPFTSSILTGIGIIILISARYRWNEKGLFWRAGIICALMKSVSPSAVIFGPMVAIFFQSLLLETMVWIFGRNYFGYILAGMMATTWNLVQKILNYILFYGYDIVGIYADLLRYAQKQLGIRFDIVWLPVLFLLMVYMLIGGIAAIAGIRLGKKLVNQPCGKLPDGFGGSSQLSMNGNQQFHHAVPWLLADIFLFAAGLMVISNAPWYAGLISTAGIGMVWVIRYKRAFRQLSKPRFWIFFVLISMVTAFVLNRVQSHAFTNGLIVGLQMNLRAVIIILGFSVLGTELYNPRIRQFFLSTSFKQLPMALELSFASLPSLIAAVPEFKVFMRSPMSVLYQMLSQIEFRLAELQERFSRQIFILTGSIGQGKTSSMQMFIDRLRDQHLSVAGVISPRVMEQEKTIGYDIIDVATNHRERFLRLSGDNGGEKIGRFKIVAEGLAAGRNALENAINDRYHYVVIDEVGKLELDSQGWARSLDALIQHSESHLILSVRDIYTEQVVTKWNLQNYRIFDVSNMRQEELAAMMRTGNL